MSRESLHDPELWYRVLDGDGRAFGTIYDRHRDRVFRHLRWLGSANTDAEDLTATVFLELWRLRARVNIVDASLLPWLLATATNVMRNANRARRRYRALLASLPPGRDAMDASVIAEDRLEVERRARSLAAAAKRLSVADQQLLFLTAFEGLSLDQVSQMLGISYGAAKTRLSRARSRLDTAYLATTSDHSQYGVTP